MSQRPLKTIQVLYKRTNASILVMSLLKNAPFFPHRQVFVGKMAAPDSLKSLNHSSQSVSLSLRLVNHFSPNKNMTSGFKKTNPLQKCHLTTCNRTQEEQFKGCLVFLFFLLQKLSPTHLLANATRMTLQCCYWLPDLLICQPTITVWYGRAALTSYGTLETIVRTRQWGKPIVIPRQEYLKKKRSQGVQKFPPPPNQLSSFWAPSYFLVFLTSLLPALGC